MRFIDKENYTQHGGALMEFCFFLFVRTKSNFTVSKKFEVPVWCAFAHESIMCFPFTEVSTYYLCSIFPKNKNKNSNSSL